jgi:hypothetical protein
MVRTVEISVKRGHLDWRVLARLLLRRLLGASPSVSESGKRGLLSSSDKSILAELAERLRFDKEPSVPVEAMLWPSWRRSRQGPVPGVTSLCISWKCFCFSAAVNLLYLE